MDIHVLYSLLLFVFSKSFFYYIILACGEFQSPIQTGVEIIETSIKIKTYADPTR